MTIADAKWLGDRLKDAPEAKNQIAFADVIILNKTDLVGPEELREVEARIRAINPYAKLHRTTNCAVPLDTVLGRNAFDLQRILEIEPEFLNGEDEHDHGMIMATRIMITVIITITHDHHHHESHGLKHYHDEDMQSVALSIEGDVDPEKFVPWLQDYVQREGASILRAKGILAFKDEPKRFVFQGVHMLLDGDLQREWKPQERRVSRLVFIGRNLKEDEITKGIHELRGIKFKELPGRERAVVHVNILSWLSSRFAALKREPAVSLKDLTNFSITSGFIIILAVTRFFVEP